MLSRPNAVSKQYDWQRSTPPRSEPHLSFDTHFQGDGLAVPPHAVLLAGVSGGSDSLALLYLLENWISRAASPVKLHVATVDHGLRDASHAEALQVAAHCRKLGLPHSILHWKRLNWSGKTSQDARSARYVLLTDHAKSIGATCLLLGHTKNDQAETVLMRALRSTPQSSTRGLSAMTQWSHHATANWALSVYRPLLSVSRGRLKNYLSGKNITWIDDPTNRDSGSERVRVRRYLHDTADFNIDSLADFANASARLRGWINQHASRFITDHAITDSHGNCHLPPASTLENVPLPIAADAVCTLVLAFGGKPYRIPVKKAEAVAIAWLEGRPMRTNLGRTLIHVTARGMKISREKRGLQPVPTAPNQPELHDGRLLVSRQNGKTCYRPFIVGLENFLPSTDLPLRRAVMRLLNPPKSISTESAVQHKARK